MTHSPKQPTAVQMALRTATILFLFVIIFTALLSAAYVWTKPALEASAAEEKMKLINEVLPRTAYDNDLLNDTMTIEASPLLGLDEASTVYRARKDGAPSALVLEAVAPNGYSGKIRLILAVNIDGTLAGVRVTQHKETPGLGDYIEPKKDKNKQRPWITQFDGRSPLSMSEREWKVKKDGGHFDFVAGATVTPRAVIRAVRRAAQYVAENREQLLAAK